MQAGTMFSVLQDIPALNFFPPLWNEVKQSKIISETILFNRSNSKWAITFFKADMFHHSST